MFQIAEDQIFKIFFEFGMSSFILFIYSILFGIAIVEAFLYSNFYVFSTFL